MLQIVPERGGIVTKFNVQGEPVFYLDETTLFDQGKNIRGGNPVLFPICGPLQDGRYEEGGRTYAMKQHGFARNKAWVVEDVSTEKEKAGIKLKLVSDSETLEGYPFNFTLEFSYVLSGNKLTIDQRYINIADRPMPFYAGFHPYFLAPDRSGVKLDIPALSYLDLLTGEKMEFNGVIELNDGPEINGVFGDLQQRQLSFSGHGTGRVITIDFDGNFKYIVLWTLPGKDFLCIEPWMGMNYGLNKGEYVLLGPGAELKARVSITAD
jgi:galactose mutarotase-like enzyme